MKTDENDIYGYLRREGCDICYLKKLEKEILSVVDDSNTESKLEKIIEVFRAILSTGNSENLQYWAEYVNRRVVNRIEEIISKNNVDRIVAPILYVKFGVRLPIKLKIKNKKIQLLLYPIGKDPKALTINEIKIDNGKLIIECLGDRAITLSINRLDVYNSSLELKGKIRYRSVSL